MLPRSLAFDEMRMREQVPPPRVRFAAARHYASSSSSRTIVIPEGSLMIKRAKIPKNAKVLTELGTKRPDAVPYDPVVPFEMLWVVTNGSIRKNFLWIAFRNSGIYVASGGSGSHHTSYHSDGRLHSKTNKQVWFSRQERSWEQLQQPLLIQNSTSSIADDALEAFELRHFRDHPVDSVLYLDNRVLPRYISYHVYAVPPFRHGDIHLINDWPASFHMVTHTNPWIAVVIYEQTHRPKRPRG
jgi:hypothetical protein